MADPFAKLEPKLMRQHWQECEQLVQVLLRAQSSAPGILSAYRRIGLVALCPFSTVGRSTALPNALGALVKSARAFVKIHLAHVKLAQCPSGLQPQASAGCASPRLAPHPKIGQPTLQAIRLNARHHTSVHLALPAAERDDLLPGRPNGKCLC